MSIENSLKSKIEEKNLEILVVEDTPRHQDAAREQLEEYNVTIVGTYSEAQKLLLGGYRADGEKTEPKQFDVVLTDLYFTCGDEPEVSNKSSLEEERALGTYVALVAAKQGVPHIGILSAGTRHEGPEVFSLGTHCKWIRIGENSLLTQDVYASSEKKDWIRFLEEEMPRLESAYHEERMIKEGIKNEY